MYILDSNTFIQPKNLYYSFDIAPSFWKHISNYEVNTLRTIDWVKDELNEGHDDLSEWINNLDSDFFICSQKNESIIKEFALISNWVNDNSQYTQINKADFLSKADPWLIASAKIFNATLVTFELWGDSQCKKVKIPNVCEHFGVRYINLYELLRELHIQIG